jgi:DNA-binding GntR family transcriptional regulator
LAERLVTLVPLTRTGPVDDVAEALRQEVLSGFHPPGTSLDDTELAARLGVPRELVRGALASLEREGLLVHTLHRGPEVVRLSVDDVRDLFATRRTLELAGLEAMVRGRPADGVWLQAAVVSMTEAAKAGDGRAAVAADAAFHLAIVATTSSRRLRTAAEAALRELRIVLAVADRVSSDLDDLAADHAGLLDALVHAPPPSARAALLDHLRRGESRALAVTHGA